MEANILIKEDTIEKVVEITNTITEFDRIYDKQYFEDRIRDTENLILVAYIDNFPVGYIVSYDKYNDGSFYCWMAGVNPRFRQLGVLTNLMNYLYRWVKNHEFKKVKIKTRNNRREMLTFLVKSNFNFIEVEAWPLTKDNRILLEKELN